MDTAAIAAYLVAAKSQNTQNQISTAMTKQALQQDQQVVALLNEGLQAAAPAGMGKSVDITA